MRWPLLHGLRYHIMRVKLSISHFGLLVGVHHLETFATFFDKIVLLGVLMGWSGYSAKERQTRTRICIQIAMFWLHRTICVPIKSRSMIFSKTALRSHFCWIIPTLDGVSIDIWQLRCITIINWFVFHTNWTLTVLSHVISFVKSMLGWTSWLEAFYLLTVFSIIGHFWLWSCFHYNIIFVRIVQ